MDKFETIVVGGGLAGLATAYCLAKDGMEVLVVERGDYSGAKNVTGGRLYINPIRDMLPEIWNEAPLERFIAQEDITLMGDNSSVSVRLSSNRFRHEPYHSYSILRAKFDKWFADKAAEAGALLVTKQKVDSVIKENNKVIGIISGEDKILSDVVVAADGAISLTTENAGLRKRHTPKEMAVGIKEVLELPSSIIEDRFNLQEGEGSAHMFVGSLTKGMFGGGFLYTNRESLSLGMVLGIADIMARQPAVEVPDLLEEFKARPEIARLIKGSETVEYSAHTIGEGGFNTIPRLFDDGILVTGDAAGFTLNTGLTVRGMEFAIASGVIAARAIKKAKEKNDFSKESLAYYEELLKNSFIIKDLTTFKKAPEVLDNPRIFGSYPEFVCNALEKLMFIGDQPKRKMSSTLLAEVKNKLGWSWVKDIRQVLKL
jgi:electron transfer flavoprotein-quinone oxidoreductase